MEEQHVAEAREDSILSNRKNVPTPDWTIEYAPKPAKEPEFLTSLLTHSNALLRFLGLLLGYYGWAKWLEWSTAEPKLVPLLHLLHAYDQSEELRQHTWKLLVSPSSSSYAVLQHSHLFVEGFRGNEAQATRRITLAEDLGEDEDMTLRSMAWSTDEVAVAVVLDNKKRVVVVDVERGRVAVSFLACDLGLAAGVSACFWRDSPVQQKDKTIERELVIVGLAAEIQRLILSFPPACGNEEKERVTAASWYGEEYQVEDELDVDGPSAFLCPVKLSSQQVVVTAVAFSQESNLLILGGAARTPDSQLKGTVTAVRLPNKGNAGARSPTVLFSSGDSAAASSVPQALYQMATTPIAYIVDLEVSTDGEAVAAVDSEGNVAVWALGEQSASAPRQTLKHQDVQTICFAGDEASKVVHVRWWGRASDRLVLQTDSGLAAVCRMADTTNALEAGALQFAPGSEISEAVHEKFFVLERTRKMQKVALKDQNFVPAPVAVPVAQDGDTVIDQAFSMLEAGAEAVDRKVEQKEQEDEEEGEEFQEFVKLCYKMTKVHSVSASQFVAQLVQQQQVEEALRLARCYDIDADVVYMHQWRSLDKVTVDAVQSILEPMTNRTWVLQEACMESTVDSLQQRRLLIQYGLRQTLPEWAYEGKSSLRDVDLCTAHEFLVSESELAAAANKAGVELLPTDGQLHAAARARFIDALDRLLVFEKLLRCLDPPIYSDAEFKKFRDCDLVEDAKRLAAAGDFDALAILFSCCGPTLEPHRLSILSAISVLEDPKVYAAMLPARGESIPEEELPLWRGEAIDFVEVMPESWWKESTSEDERGELRELGLLPAEAEPSPSPSGYLQTVWKIAGREATDEEAMEWYKSRAIAIDDTAGLTLSSVRLLALATKRLGFSEFPSMTAAYHDMKVYSTLVFECQCVTMTYGGFLALTEYQRLELLLADSDESEIVGHLHERCWEIIQEENERIARADEKPKAEDLLLPRFLIDVSDYELAKCMAVIRASRPSADNPKDKRPIADDIVLLDTALKCVYACKGSDAATWEAMNMVFQSLPARDPERESPRYKELQDQVDEMEVHLGANELLARFNLALPMASYQNLQANQSTARQLVARLCNHAMKAKPAFGEVEWRGVIEALLILRKKVFTFISEQYCYTYFLEALLQVGQFSLAAEYVDKSSKGQSVVMRTAKEYFNSSSSSADPSLTLAKDCLSLLPAQSAKAELDLIEAVGIIRRHFPSTQLLPVQVRLADKEELVQQILADVPGAYRKPQELVRLLRLCSGKKEAAKELALQQSIAMMALSKHDYEAAYEICAFLMSQQVAAAWPLCEQLASALLGPMDLSAGHEANDSGEEDEEVKAPVTTLTADQRLAMLSFALRHCPDEAYHRLMALWMRLDLELLEEEEKERPRPPVESRRQLRGKEMAKELVPAPLHTSIRVPLFYQDIYKVDAGPGMDEQWAEEAREAVLAEQVDAMKADCLWSTVAGAGGSAGTDEEEEAEYLRQELVLIRSYLHTDTQIAATRLLLLLSEEERLGDVTAFLHQSMGDTDDEDAAKNTSAKLLVELAAYCLACRLLQLLSVPFDVTLLTSRQVIDLAAGCLETADVEDGSKLGEYQAAFRSFHKQMEQPKAQLWRGKVSVPTEAPAGEAALDVVAKMLAVAAETKGLEEEMLWEVEETLAGWKTDVGDCWKAMLCAAVGMAQFRFVDEILSTECSNLPAGAAQSVLEAMADSETCPPLVLYRCAVHLPKEQKELRQSYLKQLVGDLQKPETEVKSVCDVQLASALLKDAAVPVADVVAAMQRQEFFQFVEEHIRLSVSWSGDRCSWDSRASAKSGIVAEGLPYIVGQLVLAGELSKAATLVGRALRLEQHFFSWANCLHLLRHFLVVHSTEVPSEEEGELDADYLAGRGYKTVTSAECAALCAEALAAAPLVEVAR